MKRKIFNFDVIVGKTISVTVLSEEDDTFGDKARRILSNGIEDIQSFGLPSSCDEITVEGDTVEEICAKVNEHMGGWNEQTLILNEDEDYENPHMCQC